LADAASALFCLVQNTDHQGPLNIGSGVAISAADLVDEIFKVANVPIAIEVSKAGPAGVSSRNTDSELANRLLGWSASTSLSTWLTELYNENCGYIDGLSGIQLGDLASRGTAQNVEVLNEDRAHISPTSEEQPVNSCHQGRAHSSAFWRDFGDPRIVPGRRPSTTDQ
jgi:hypothetical protein